MATITFKTGDASIAADPEYEIARILRQVASEIEKGSKSGTIRDTNGNKIGTYKR